MHKELDSQSEVLFSARMVNSRGGSVCYKARTQQTVASSR